MAFLFEWEEILPKTSDLGGVDARAWKAAPRIREVKLGVRERQCILRKQDGTQWDTVGQYVAMVSSEDQVAPAHDAVAESLVSVDFNSTQAADWLFTATLNAHWVSTDDNFLDSLQVKMAQEGAGESPASVGSTRRVRTRAERLAELTEGPTVAPVGGGPRTLELTPELVEQLASISEEKLSPELRELLSGAIPGIRSIG